MIEIRHPNGFFHIEADETNGVSRMVDFQPKGKRLEKRKMLYKGFEDIQELYRYISECHNIPIFKLRLMSRRIDEEKVSQQKD